jgi:lysine 6-dehydrogenase
MKAAVLGGTGLTGRCAVYDLSENQSLEEIRVIDINKNVEFNNPKVKYYQADARDTPSVVKALKGVDVLINAVQYYYNVDIMKAALEAKVNYIDLGGLYYTTLEQLKLDQEFKNQNILAIIGMGAQPGISSVLVSYGASKLDRIDSIKIRDAWVDKTNYQKLFFTWSPMTLFDEFTLQAVYYDNGLKEVPPFSNSEEFDFGWEVGKVRVFRTVHSELATIPESFVEKGVKYVEWLEGSPDIEKLKFLSDIGFGRKDKINIRGIEISPREFLFEFLKEQGMLYPPPDLQIRDYEVTVAELSGVDSGKKKTVKMFAYFKYDEKWKVSASQKEVGVPASIAAQMILNGTIKGKGVKPPEQIVPAKQFFQELAKRDIKIAAEESYEIN